MKISLIKIIWNDWPALFSACAIPLVWVLHFAFPYLKRSGPPPLEFTIGLTCLAAFALWWRVARVKKLFSSGGTADGVVEAVRIVKDRGRLEYSYYVEERVLCGWCAVHKSKQVLALRVGQKITVVFDRQRPEKSIVADLFVAT